MIIVTGATGFIGSNIVATLNERGCNDIVVCDWLGDDGRWQNLRKRLFCDHVFPEDLFANLPRMNVEAVIHMGANSSTTAVDGDEIMRLNFQYTLRLIDWCAEAKVPLVYASSAATYGDGSHGYVDDFSLEQLYKLRPLNLYGWSKHQIDLIVADRAERGLALPPKCIGLKFFNVYGPNEFHKGAMTSVVGKNYRQANDGQPISLFKSHRPEYPDGGQLRDFVYVEDVVDVVLWALSSGPAHAVLNVGSGKAQSFAAFVEALYAACGQTSQIEYIDMPEVLRDRYQYFTEASLSNLRDAGYNRAFLSVEEGVARYVNWLSAADPYR